MFAGHANVISLVLCTKEFVKVNKIQAEVSLLVNATANRMWMDLIATAGNIS